LLINNQSSLTSHALLSANVFDNGLTIMFTVMQLRIFLPQQSDVNELFYLAYSTVNWTSINLSAT